MSEAEYPDGTSEENAANRLMDKHGARIRQWEQSENEVLRELARAIRDNADGGRST